MAASLRIFCLGKRGGGRRRRREEKGRPTGRDRDGDNRGRVNVEVVNGMGKPVSGKLNRWAGAAVVDYAVCGLRVSSLYREREEEKC